MKIGVFDSGIGGVTVLKEIIKKLPSEEYFYYSDSIHNPYGEKNKNEIIKLCDNIVNYLVEKGCQIIVIACNTASANASEYLRNKYSTIPILAIEPAYKMIYDYAIDDTTLVLATQATIESEKFQKLYKLYNNNQTSLIECIGLANLIENNKEEDIKKYLEENLGKYSGKVKSVVLGCTHYPLIQDQIKAVLGNDIKIFDGAPGLAKHLESIVKKNNFTSSHNFKINFFDSSNSIMKKERFFNHFNK